MNRYGYWKHLGGNGWLWKAWPWIGYARNKKSVKDFVLDFDPSNID